MNVYAPSTHQASMPFTCRVAESGVGVSRPALLPLLHAIVAVAAASSSPDMPTAGARARCVVHESATICAL